MENTNTRSNVTVHSQDVARTLFLPGYSSVYNVLTPIGRARVNHDDKPPI